MNIHIHHHYGRDIKEMFHDITHKLDKIMATIAQLNTKVDELQVSLDAEQAQIQAALDKLNTTITDLNVIIADGGTAAERQALADKLDAIKADLEGTIVDEPVDPPVDPTV